MPQDLPQDVAHGVDNRLVEAERRRGRGARSNVGGRFEPEAREAVDDGWGSLEELAPFATTVQVEAAKTIISTNTSPDLGFDQSINPYRGCEHGCSSVSYTHLTLPTILRV